MATVIVKPHNCKDVPYQDAKYGKGNRVANKREKNGTYRCTGCGKELDKAYLLRG